LRNVSFRPCHVLLDMTTVQLRVGRVGLGRKPT